MADDLELMVPADCGRWPGFSEQSWMERFNELDRRYEAAANNALERAFKYAEAADEITRLRAELAALRGAVADEDLDDDAQYDARIGAQVAIWQAMEGLGYKPTSEAVKIIRRAAFSAIRAQPKDEAHG